MSANTIHNKLLLGDWKEWDSYTNKDFRDLQRRRVKRKFDKVSREEIESGVKDGELDGYGKYDESDLIQRDWFFDD